MSLNAIILGQAIASVLFALFCMKYVWPPLMAAIEKRQKEVAGSLTPVKRARKDLDFAKASVIGQLEEVKAEAQVTIKQTNKHRSQILGEAKVEAEQERTKIMAQVQVEVKAGRRRACEELRKRIAILTVADTEKIIERSVDEVANSDTVDKLVAGL